MKGTINYDLWTVSGTITIMVRYSIIPTPGGESAIGSIEINGAGDAPPEELQNEDVRAEIIQACVEDYRKKSEKTDYVRITNAPLWGSN